MRRDFSEDSYNELVALVNEVEDEKWCDFTDWFGDRWLDIQDLLGQLNLEDYVDDLKAYHKKVIDKNNTSVSDIDQIFRAVDLVDSLNATVFLAYKKRIDQYKTLIDSFSNVIDPSNGSFNPKKLKYTIKKYEIANTTFSIFGAGNLEFDTDLSDFADTIGGIAAAAIDVSNIDVGATIEQPIGPGMVFFYSVDVSAGNGDNINLAAVVEKQKIKLENFSINTSVGKDIKIKSSVDKKGNPTLSVSRNGVSAKLDKDGISGSFSSKDSEGNVYKVSMKYSNGTLTISESISTTLNGTTVTTTAGIKMKIEDWQTVPVEVPDNIEVPNYYREPAWESLRTIDPNTIDWDTLRRNAGISTGVGVVIIILMLLLSPLGI